MGHPPRLVLEKSDRLGQNTDSADGVALNISALPRSHFCIRLILPLVCYGNQVGFHDL